MDLLQIYGIDIADSDRMSNRSWRWLRNKIVGLLSTECRTQRLLNPIKQTDPKNGPSRT